MLIKLFEGSIAWRTLQTPSSRSSRQVSAAVARVSTVDRAAQSARTPTCVGVAVGSLAPDARSTRTRVPRVRVSIQVRGQGRYRSSERSRQGRHTCRSHFSICIHHLLSAKSAQIVLLTSIPETKVFFWLWQSMKLKMCRCWL